MERAQEFSSAVERAPRTEREVRMEAADRKMAEFVRSIDPKKIGTELVQNAVRAS